jgi:hypothetical protein
VTVYRDVKLADPFLRPYWRHERVVKMLDTVPPERCKRTDDEWIRGYKSFLYQWNKSEDNRDKLLYENPGLYFAYILFDNMHMEPELRLMIEARLLAGLSYAEIAQACKTIPQTIEWYERLFFNVSDFLTHNDWIVKHVLLPASSRFISDDEDDEDDDFQVPASSAVVDPHLDMSLKFFAYYGGPIVCDVMISGFRRDRKVRSHDELEDYFNDQFATQIQMRSAQAAGRFEVNKYNVTELFATHTRIIELQKSVKGDDERQSDLVKHIGEMFSELPYSVGREGASLYKDSPIGKFDDGAAELDAEEIQLLGAGVQPNSLAGVHDLSISARKEPENNAKPK